MTSCAPCKHPSIHYELTYAKISPCKIHGYHGVVRVAAVCSLCDVTLESIESMDKSAAQLLLDTWGLPDD